MAPLYWIIINNSLVYKQHSVAGQDGANFNFFTLYYVV